MSSEEKQLGNKSRITTHAGLTNANTTVEHDHTEGWKTVKSKSAAKDKNTNKGAGGDQSCQYIYLVV